MWTRELHPVVALADLATDPAGAIFITGAQPVAGPARQAPMLVQLSASGGVLYAAGASGDGAGHALATDACGDAYQVFSLIEPSFDEYVVRVRKLAF